MNIEIIEKVLNYARDWENVVIVLSGASMLVESFSETTAIRIDDDEVYVENDGNIYYIDPDEIIAIGNKKVKYL